MCPGSLVPGQATITAGARPARWRRILGRVEHRAPTIHERLEGRPDDLVPLGARLPQRHGRLGVGAAQSDDREQLTRLGDRTLGDAERAPPGQERERHEHSEREESHGVTRSRRARYSAGARHTRLSSPSSSIS